MSALIKTVFLATLLGLSTVGCADNAPAPNEPPTSAEDIQTEEDTSRTTRGDKPAIWQIADEDTNIYLFGTVHLLPREISWRDQEFNDIWQSADTVYFETDATSPEAMGEMQRLMQVYGMNEPGITFSSFFSEEEYAVISAEARALQLPPAMLEPMRPWLAGLLIGVQRLITEGADPTAGVEALLAAEAVQASKQIRYFETNEEQIRFFADFSDELSARMLIINLEQMSENPDMFDDLITLWQTGQIEELGTMVNDSLMSTGTEVAETLLYTRNQRWVTELVRVLEEEEGVIFVAVGAGHLAGKNSVQEYLAEQGVEANRL